MRPLSPTVTEGHEALPLEGSDQSQRHKIPKRRKEVLGVRKEGRSEIGVQGRQVKRAQKLRLAHEWKSGAKQRQTYQAEPVVSLSCLSVEDMSRSE